MIEPDRLVWNWGLTSRRYAPKNVRVLVDANAPEFVHLGDKYRFPEEFRTHDRGNLQLLHAGVVKMV
jgi:hypothetical protein